MLGPQKYSETIYDLARSMRINNLSPAKLKFSAGCIYEKPQELTKVKVARELIYLVVSVRNLHACRDRRTELKRSSRA